MKRNDDLLRDILFEFEAADDWLVVFVTRLGMSSDEREKLGHINLLVDAGFIAQVGDGTYRLTNSGYDYLEAVRSDNVWSKTKDAASQVGGVTLGVMKDLGVAYLKQELAEKTGIVL